jgi:LacI family transcriptional regulator, galactose operon repressor
VGNDPNEDRSQGNRPTMRDVAALAGVGVMTVSRVVNGRDGVSDQRAARVWRAIEQLDYRHNVTARHLRLTGQATATVGVLLDDVANPFAGELLRAVEDVVGQHDSLVLCASSDGDADRERALLSAFCERRVDGLIIMPCASDYRYLLPEVRRGIQLAFVDRPAPMVAADTVISDNGAGARRAVTHLVDQGHTRIGFLGGVSEVYTAGERYQGYLEALRLHGIDPDERLVRRDIRTEQEAGQSAHDLLRGPGGATALFTSQNMLTAGTRLALQSAGAQRRIAQVGFDDVPFGSLVEPGITVIAQDPPALGALAAQMLIRRIHDPDRAPETVQVPVSLLVRGSGEISPADRGPDVLTV